MTPTSNRAHSKPVSLTGAVSALFLATALIAAPVPAHAGDVPTFAVDPSWPKPLPNNWILGQIGGITVDAQDHIWVFQRPRSLTDDERAPRSNPPRSKCCVPAPSVLVFTPAGNLLQSVGRPRRRLRLARREHGILVDDKGFVWLGGNGDNDDMILKFTTDGKFVMQIGKRGPMQGQQRHRPSSARPPRLALDEAGERDLRRRRLRQSARHRVRRRHRRDTSGIWGAYGKPPNDDEARRLRSEAASQAIRQSRALRDASPRRPRLCLRPVQQPHPGVPQGRQVRARNTSSSRRRCGTGSVWGVAFSARPGADTICRAPTAPTTRSAMLRATTAQWSAASGAPGRNAGAIPLGARQARRLQGQLLHRRGRHRKAHAEVQADVGRATIDAPPKAPAPQIAGHARRGFQK